MPSVYLLILLVPTFLFFSSGKYSPIRSDPLFIFNWEKQLEKAKIETNNKNVFLILNVIYLEFKGNLLIGEKVKKK